MIDCDDDLARRADLPGVLSDAIRSSRMFFLETAEGVHIPVRAFGEEQGGLPVVMAHGMQSHSVWFAQSGRFLADSGHPNYIVERRGSGISREARGHADGFEEMADDLWTVAEWAMQQHGVAQVHLLGHCFGAIPAAVLACRKTLSVRSLIIPTPGLFTHSDLSLGQKLQIAVSMAGRRRAKIPVPLEPAQFTNIPEFRRFIDRDELSLSNATVSLYLAIPRARRFLQQNVSMLCLPVFMATAARDAICDNARNAAYFERIPSPRKQHIEYGEAIHILEFSPAREEFFSDLVDWLRRFA